MEPGVSGLGRRLTPGRSIVLLPVLQIRMDLIQDLVWDLLADDFLATTAAFVRSLVANRKTFRWLTTTHIYSFGGVSHAMLALA